MSLDLHAGLNTTVIVSLAAGCGLAVLPRWVGLTALASRVRVPAWLFASADAVWTFGLLVLAMIFVAAGTYSPFLYFRF
jgi:hypothetical protein